MQDYTLHIHNTQEQEQHTQQQSKKRTRAKTRIGTLARRLEKHYEELRKAKAHVRKLEEKIAKTLNEIEEMVQEHNAR
nr:hypothetical protein [uncultured bacterium]AUH21232.1 hypothetical protein [uncultured bacterium]AUH21235.1 hypothetical protein [uncultured bacterium]AUH21239.1 hypothetical protein [uncultured bacterium]AUH21250.1 hypothetical protein [uncultured bacterium]